MKVLRSAIMVIFTAILLFLGVSLLWTFLAESWGLNNPFDYVATAEFISSSPTSWQLGIAFLFAGVIIILLKLREIRREQCIAFDNPDGEVAISMDAVEDFIRRVGGEFEGVKSLLPSIHAGPEGIGVTVRMDLWSGANIPRLSEEMQNAIKSRVQDTLGINVNYVSVNVGKIIGEGETREAIELEEAEEE